MMLYSFLSFVTFLLYLQASLHVFRSMKRNDTNMSFGVATMVLSILSLLYFITSICDCRGTLQIVDSLAQASWIIFPAVLVYFIQSFTGNPFTVLRKLYLYGQIPLAVFLIISYKWNILPYYLFPREAGMLWPSPAANFSVWFWLLAVYVLISSILFLGSLFYWHRKQNNTMNNKQRLGFYVMAITWPLAVFLGFLPDLLFSFQTLNPVTPILHLASLPLAGMVFYLLIITNIHTDRWDEIAVLFFEKIRQFVFFVDHNGKITSVNRFSEKMLHYSAGELIGKDLDCFFQESEFIREQLSAAQKGKNTQSGVCLLITKKRTAFPVHVSVLKIHDKAGHIAGFVLTGFDYRNRMELCKQIRERMNTDFELVQKRKELEGSIASRKKELEYANASLQREIKKSDNLEQKKLKELETKKKILREIHHRVKNNMQMVVSLVNLMHGQKKVCAECRTIFRDMSVRVRDIAVIQEYMYESPYVTRIHFGNFIAKMTKELKSKITAQEHVSIHILMADDEITIEHAIPCGIIIYELLSNSLKYAFPPSMVNSRGSVARSFVNVAFSWSDNGYSLTVEDNGIGIPLDNDQPLYKQVGLQMVDVLVNDYIHGEIYYNNHEGTRVTIVFKELASHKPPLYHEPGIVD